MFKFEPQPMPEVKISRHSYLSCRKWLHLVDLLPLYTEERTCDFRLAFLYTEPIQKGSHPQNERTAPVGNFFPPLIGVLKKSFDGIASRESSFILLEK